MTSELIGKKVTFYASRILKGNPVKGTVVAEDETWITLRLSKTIEGMTTIWFMGEEKQFRKTLILGAIKVTK